MSLRLSAEDRATLDRISARLSKHSTVQVPRYKSTLRMSRADIRDDSMPVRVPVVETQTVDCTDAHARFLRMFERHYRAAEYRRRRYARKTAFR